MRIWTVPKACLTFLMFYFLEFRYACTLFLALASTYRYVVAWVMGLHAMTLQDISCLYDSDTSNCNVMSKTSSSYFLSCEDMGETDLRRGL